MLGRKIGRIDRDICGSRHIHRGDGLVSCNRYKRRYISRSVNDPSRADLRLFLCILYCGISNLRPAVSWGSRCPFNRDLILFS